MNLSLSVLHFFRQCMFNIEKLLLKWNSSSSECFAQVLHCKRRNLGCSSAEGRSSTANSGTKAAVLLGYNRCGSFPFLSASHSLFSIWTNLKRSEKIQGAPTRWAEWICLTGPSGLHRNLPQGLNISSIRVLTRSEIRKSQSTFAPKMNLIHYVTFHNISFFALIFYFFHIKN